MARPPHKAETVVLHAGWRADPATGAVAVPIYQTTSYQFQSADHAANLFALKELGNIYTRIMNPTTDVLEKRVAALDGGVAGLALASGQSATTIAVQNLARAGDNIVSSTDLYGGTWNLFANTMKDQGIEVRFVDPEDPESFAPRHRRPHPRLLCRNAAQSEAHRLPDRRSGGDRTPARHSAHRRQHRGAAADPAARSRRGGGGVFDHQISRRPRQFDRRNHRRRRQFPLGGFSRAAAGAQHAGPELSRRGVEPGGQAAGADRLYHQGARDAVARSRFGDFALQRLPHPAGRRDAGAAHGAPLRQCFRRRRLPRQAAGSDAG